MQNDIHNALQTLQTGGVILYPTDTVWGLGCDATNEQAIKKIFAIKHRDDAKSLILLANSLRMVNRYVNEIPDAALKILDVAVEPLTIIYPEGRNLPAVVLAEDNSIAFRIVDEPFCNELLKRLKKPIVSTSANISGQSTPAYFKKITPEIINAVDYVVAWRQNDITPAKVSSIIKISSTGSIQIIRK